MTEAIAQRLSAAGIELLADTGRYYLFTRGDFIALVERKSEGFGGIGSTGIFTEAGISYLVWQGERPFLVGKGIQQIATQEQVTAIRHFSSDLTNALR